MSTHYSLYLLQDGQNPDQPITRKRLIGVRTFENKKRCFTWHMNPGEFAYQIAFCGPLYAVENEYGERMMLVQFVDILRGIDIMRYDRDQPLELNQAQRSPQIDDEGNIVKATSREEFLANWQAMLDNQAKEKGL